MNNSINKFKFFESVFLFINIIVVLIIVFNISSIDFFKRPIGIILTLWVIIPYVIIFVFSTIIQRIKVIKRKKLAQKVITYLAGLIFLFTIFGYSGASTSSTGGLVFIFFPLYILFGFPFVFVIIMIISKKF